MTTAPRFPMPVRVPELAPALGQVVVPRRVRSPWIPLDDIREQLATHLLELAGSARSAATEEHRDAALRAVSRDQWAGAWDEAVRRVAERAWEAIDAQIDVTARRVRMPARRRRRHHLTLAEKRAIAARLAAGGGTLIAALDALESAAAAAQSATVLDKEAHAAWQEALRLSARRLEAAWLALETAVAHEEARWEAELAAIAQWRPALWPVFAFWVPVAAGLLVLGLILGGYVAAPQWLAELLGF